MNQDIKKRAVHRAKIIEGQMKGLTKAIVDEKYCIDLLVQTLSIRESLKSLTYLLLENHLRTHVRHQLSKKGKDDKAIRELMKIFSLSDK